MRFTLDLDMFFDFLCQMASLLLAFAQTQFAVGDTFRRLAGKLLMDSVVARVTAHLRPEQIAFHVSTQPKRGALQAERNAAHRATDITSLARS